MIAISMVMLAALFLMIGCEGDQGPAGQDAATVCTDCHNDNTLIVAIAAQWGTSVHASGGTLNENMSSCSPCHTSEGFIAYLATGDGGAPENPSAIGCFTCHEPHTNYNFDRRTTAPVTLRQGGGTFDSQNGDANLCANCHQARAASPQIPTSGEVKITSKRWGPHHGPQGNVLSGNSAYEFTGPYDSSTPHYIAGCPTCHMAPAVGIMAGGHTMGLIEEGDDYVAGCEASECHTVVDDFNYHGVQDSVDVLIGALRSALIDANILDSSDYALVPTGDTLTLSITQAGALFNFQMFREDRSLGVHNPNYAIAALNASVEAMAGR